MPGSGSNKRFEATFGTDYNSQVKVSIIDSLYSGEPYIFKIDNDAGGLELSYNTNDQDPYQRVDTMTANMAIVNDSEATQSFFTDLLDAEEDRFYLEILNEFDQLQFLGKIVPDDMTQQDRYQPPIKLVAICSTTDLKNIDYDAEYDVYVPKTVAEILLYCLNKLSISSLYSNSEIILMCQSNIDADVSYSLTNLFNVIRVHNYFYTVENEIKKPLKCFDVINELCGRLNCKMAYEHGRWNFTGMEGMFEDRVGSYIFYGKDGSVLSGTSPANTVVDLSELDVANYGGVYRHTGAINKVVLNIDKNFTNKVYGDGDFFDLNYPGPEHSYYEVGYLLKDEPYTLKFKNNILFADGLTPIPYNFRIKYTVKITILGGSSTETEYEFEYPFNVAQYEHKIVIASNGSDRKLEAKAEIIEVNPVGSGVEALTCRINYNLTKDKETETTEFKAYLDNANVKIKTIKNIGSDRYGKDMVKFIFNPNETVEREVTDEWKLSSSDSYTSLEIAIVSHMLKYLRFVQRYYSVTCIVTNDYSISTTAFKYEYKGEVFRLMSWKRQMIKDVCTLNLLKIPTGDSSGIIAVEDIPAVNGNTSNFSNTITDVNTVITEEFENITTNNVELNYDLPDTTLQSSLKNNISVYVEGVRWRHVNTIGTRKNTYAINPATNVITFFRALDNANVIVIIHKIFVTGEAF